MNLEIRLLTPDLWPALTNLFGEKGACYGCWCMYWRIGNARRVYPVRGPDNSGGPRYPQ